MSSSGLLWKSVATREKCQTGPGTSKVCPTCYAITFLTRGSSGWPCGCAKSLQFCPTLCDPMNHPRKEKFLLEVVIAHVDSGILDPNSKETVWPQPIFRFLWSFPSWAPISLQECSQYCFWHQLLWQEMSISTILAINIFHWSN